EDPPDPWPVNVEQSRAMTQVLDHEIGRLLAATDPATTAVIFVGDNGTPANATVLPWDPSHGKGTLYQGGINVPLIVRVPGQGPAVPQECHELVSVADLHYTLADLAGVVVAPEPGQEGPHSLAQYTNSAYDLNGSTPRTHVWSESFAQNFVPDPDGTPPDDYFTERHDRAVRSLTHKLIEWQDGTTVTRELYRLYDDAFPVPQDPALIPDPYEQDPLDIADLDPVDQDAYDELSALLDAEGPLPLWLEYTNTAEFVREAAAITTGFGQQTQCTGKPIHILFDDGPQPRRERAFLDFDVSAAVLDGAEILGVDLAVAVRTGGGSSTEVEVRAMPQPGQDYTGFGSCLQLFGSIAIMPTYALEDGWNVSAAHKRFDLGAAAADDIATAVSSPDPTFSVGLKLLHEEPAFEDTIELYDIAGALPHRIYVRYRPAP
ncbi:MAG: sulfatase-like hydrolase/transferase, partial [Actinobacteria bacterium]|nr:sulfatase-like hydrolase/transferase [Actinomycetota bacterium]